MRVLATVCSKGGVGKTTTTANLGGLLADAGLRVLLIDLDSQPTLSSYYELSPAMGGVYELLATELVDLDQIISHTVIPNLDIIVSNDYRNQLQQLLLNAPNGRFRLIDLLDRFADRYDAILIDTQGARSVMLEMAVMAADRLISPIVPVQSTMSPRCLDYQVIGGCAWRHCSLWGYRVRASVRARAFQRGCWVIFVRPQANFWLCSGAKCAPIS